MAPRVLSQTRYALAIVAFAATVSVLIIVHGRSGLMASLNAASPAPRATALTAARFQELAAMPDCCAPTKVPVEDVYEEYNMCQSCMVKCKMFEHEGCGFNVMKEQCLPDILIEGCEECANAGCEEVITFLNEND